MAKYQKLPVVIEAYQLGETLTPEFYAWAKENNFVVWVHGVPCGLIYIETLEGDMAAQFKLLARSVFTRDMKPLLTNTVTIATRVPRRAQPIPAAVPEAPTMHRRTSRFS